MIFFRMFLPSPDNVSIGRTVKRSPEPPNALLCCECLVVNKCQKFRPSNSPMEVPRSRFGKYGIIKHMKSGLVLDATCFGVKLQTFYPGAYAQLWKLAEAGAGRVLIINRGNGKILDLVEGPVLGSIVITREKLVGLSALTQEWYLDFDHTIVNGVVGNFTLDTGPDFSPGTFVVVQKKTARDPQQFSILYDSNESL